MSLNEIRELWIYKETQRQLLRNTSGTPGLNQINTHSIAEA
jgi:hypothetical protein